ncbi:hypothetical protein [Methylocystis sp.]|uniref:hypothetical protein n=1 Tax=Methylocystis sp. TaxID=1911079 RepID=UPI003DA6C308
MTLLIGDVHHCYFAHFDEIASRSGALSALAVSGDTLSQTQESQRASLDQARRRRVGAGEGFDVITSPAANGRNRTDGAWRGSCGNLFET